MDNSSASAIGKRRRVEKYLSEHLIRELGRMHVYCEQWAISVFPWDTTYTAVVLARPDYDKPIELLERLKLAWIEHLISGEKVEV